MTKPELRKILMEAMYYSDEPKKYTIKVEDSFFGNVVDIGGLETGDPDPEIVFREPSALGESTRKIKLSRVVSIV